MGVFSRIKKVRSTQGGNYIRPGDYLFMVNRVKIIESQAPGKDSYYVAELKVLEADKTEEDSKPNMPGSEASWLVELPGEYPDLALGNIKAFLTAAYSSLSVQNGDEPLDDDDIDEEAADDAIGEDNPLAGVFLRGKAYHKATKKGGVFTRLNWSVPDDLEELVEKYAA